MPMPPPFDCTCESDVLGRCILHGAAWHCLRCGVRINDDVGHCDDCLHVLSLLGRRIADRRIPAGVAINFEITDRTSSAVPVEFEPKVYRCGHCGQFVANPEAHACRSGSLQGPFDLLPDEPKSARHWLIRFCSLIWSRPLYVVVWTLFCALAGFLAGKLLIHHGS